MLLFSSYFSAVLKYRVNFIICMSFFDILLNNQLTIHLPYIGEGIRFII